MKKKPNLKNLQVRGKIVIEETVSHITRGKLFINVMEILFKNNKNKKYLSHPNQPMQNIVMTLK